MAVYTGSQDPTVTPTAGIAYEDRFDRSNGAQYVKGEPSGTNTDWFQTASPAPSTGDPDTYTVAPSEADFTNIQDAIDQAVSDGASILSPKLIKIFPGNYPENVELVDGINLYAPTGNVNLSGIVTVEGSSSIFAEPANGLTRGIVLVNGLQINGDAGTGILFAITNATLFGVSPTFSQTLNNPCSITFENCLVSAGDVSLFQATDPTVFNNLKLRNCEWNATLDIDGRFVIKIERLTQPASFLGLGVTIQNNDIFNSEIFAGNPIQISESALKHLELSGLGGAPGWIDNSTIASNAVAPFSGEAVLINGGGGIFTNCVLGEPIIGSGTALVDVPNGQFIALKTRLLTNNVGVNLGATAITQLYSAEIAASGVDRAVDGVAGGVVLLGNTLFLNDNRINPALTIVNSGTLAQASAGTDVSAPVAPGYQVA